MDKVLLVQESEGAVVGEAGVAGAVSWSCQKFSPKSSRKAQRQQQEKAALHHQPLQQRPRPLKPPVLQQWFESPVGNRHRRFRNPPVSLQHGGMLWIKTKNQLHSQALPLEVVSVEGGRSIVVEDGDAGEGLLEVARRVPLHEYGFTLLTCLYRCTN
jgi:hypothetical protein